MEIKKVVMYNDGNHFTQYEVGNTKGHGNNPKAEVAKIKRLSDITIQILFDDNTFLEFTGFQLKIEG